MVLEQVYRALNIAAAASTISEERNGMMQEQITGKQWECPWCGDSGWLK